MRCIRTSGIEDIDNISKVLAASWKTAYRGIVNDDYLDSLTDNHWIELLNTGMNNDGVFAMVIEDQDIIGAAILGKTEKEHEINLISFYLHPDKIGQGFGHVFYNGIEAELKAKGFSECVLDVLEYNKRAIRFYESHGFAITNSEVLTTLGNHEYVCKVYRKHIG
jgi:ribosomal protein S18 acetylase RimI-like enzyme